MAGGAPKRKSISHTAISQSTGPKSRRLTSKRVVNASNTRCRGPTPLRITVTSVSDGVVTATPSLTRHAS